MESKEFSKRLIRRFDIEVEGSALNIRDVHPLSEKVDYSDDDSVNIMATKAFLAAEGFYHLIKNNYDVKKPSAFSKDRIEMYLALAGLTCEIYMKCIIYFEKRHGGKQCRGHKLNKLFLLLPDDFKDLIRRSISEVDTILPKIGDAFESLRYDYELNFIQGEYLLLFDLMEVLHNICEFFPKRTVGEVRYTNGTLAFE